jgi:cytochrome oxidase assembly protein ShyY1
MMSSLKRGLKFDFEWRITLFTLVMVPLMVSLGFWQLERAQDKAHLAAAFEERQQQAPAPISGLWDKTAEALAYLPVQLIGSFLPDKYFLLDNQVQHGQFGYDVLRILQLSDGGGTVLVNLGWVAGDAARRVLPAVPMVDGTVEISGHIYIAPGEPFMLAEQQLGNAWPKLIQAVEMDKLAPTLAALQGDSVFPFPVRVDAGEPGALQVDWQLVNMSPQTHQGYAVQWFAMAAVLFVFFLFRSSNLWQMIRGSGSAGK